ncbi:hypothetical protein CLAFUW4_05425 [Fulvia fulva]|uniref:Uncharacterized protein n=1 Tax=Passalora fulva TaxID=5499 RepID=A0A9Q8LI89_PASFU|nr:uncharacterized protein CLAFUR5_05571 [Fulvia fulva]KAK4623628.1 hypothetical protein CLAFUR4_05419 [Fulvia fulva]KAK4625257.1 hypothetical protein CLAFUR0_05427 [Fulvia fulva]UJO17891.1 hypothetical protein CLAFUR5_05571 [Fulvia fulva]WPV14594.1 hypothetical protein CLAFUW4_05425 [Fulvia fulva]WPV29558.1 hypothetical protein CLAFUW7_05423 [Fulvia fulva]
MDRTDSLSPRFSDNGSPRFTEHFNASPPYQPFQPFQGDNDPPTPQYVTAQESPIQHRPSDKRPPPLSPSEIVAPYPEFYESNDEGKEVVVPSVMPEAYERPPDARPQRRQICGLPLLWVLIIAGVVVALAIGLGLGVGLSNGKR